MLNYLGISIDRLLTLDMLKGSKVLAGKNSLNNRITKVNVMEVPDIVEWVSSGEFLITTAYSIRDNIEVLNEIIPRLKNKGVSGLGIKIGRYIKELPHSIINLADKLEFPIIQIPFSVSHTDIISEILTHVVSEQTNMLMNMEQFNREVMDIMIGGGDLKKITQKLYDNIGNSLAIYENITDNFEIISKDDLPKDELEKIIYNYLGQNHHVKDKFITTIDIINEREIERVNIPIVIDNFEYGYIFIWIDKKILTPVDKIMIESYLHIIALEFVKLISLHNMESNYKLEFFDDLLSQNKSKQKKALEKSKTYNFIKGNKYSVILFLLKEWNENNENNLQEEKNKLLFIINRVTKPYKNEVIYVEKSDRIILLYRNSEKDSQSKIKSDTITLSKRIYSEANKRIVSVELVVGVGRSYLDTSELYRSYEQAKLIVENLSKNSTDSILHYDDLGIYRILAYDGLKSELVDFCNDTIMPLVKYDNDNNTELVKTLKSYFKYNGNMKKISQKMYMHYNTILYRIQKIKDITGLDVEESSNRLNLQIALKILDIIDIN